MSIPTKSKLIHPLPLANFVVGCQEPKYGAGTSPQTTSAISITSQLPGADDRASGDTAGMVAMSVVVENGVFHIENGELAYGGGGRACSTTPLPGTGITCFTPERDGIH